jgi:hypothetical protein
MAFTYDTKPAGQTTNYLKKEDAAYLLLENGMKIIIFRTFDNDSKPSGSFSYDSKPSG